MRIIEFILTIGHVVKYLGLALTFPFLSLLILGLAIEAIGTELYNGARR